MVVVGSHSKKELPSLTGLRFAAALIVFLIHAQILQYVPDGSPRIVYAFAVGLGSPGVTSGYAAVSFFFMLSGFVLTWSARPSTRLSSFWRRRYLRAYPSHLVVLAFAILLAFLAGRTVGWWSIADAALLQSWIPDPAVFYGVNPVTWTLSCEVFFYLIFPVAHRLLARFNARSLWPALLALWSMMLLMPVIAQLLPGQTFGDFKVLSATQFWFVAVLPISASLQFLAGILVARIVAEGRWPRFPRVVVFTSFVLCCAASTFIPFLFSIYAITFVPLVLILGSFAVADVRGERTLFGRPALVWLGNLTFAFYLVHELVLDYGRKLAPFDFPPHAAGSLMWIFAAFALSLALAYLLHHGVELPAMRRWGGRRPNAASQQSAGSDARPDFSVRKPE
ncbi:acyltransferase family protein [Pseudosporangium ferrugineum]|uniref:Peptidoglycan/LPS O-acetylase OafA/YrhL n=1 Tax=Pseudosporangium ferrugineum TaxID=439699 RepID=A0A2T0R902_9ACTN|nr:acyltransferase [Pseudosporangium ferrugineum]PRY17651.1 peptidoglycan/LPS O-acetylase OafA/YrhL [Pseudosporangium ferrugineum]